MPVNKVEDIRYRYLLNIMYQNSIVCPGMRQGYNWYWRISCTTKGCAMTQGGFWVEDKSTANHQKL